MGNHVLIVTSGNDGDGWASAAIAAKYFIEKQEYANVSIHFWDHNQSTDDIVHMIRTTDPEIICMTNITLPDAFVFKYAKRIMLIDTHTSSMRDTPYKALLKSNWSVTSHPLILDWYENPAKRCATCELVWYHFYGTKIPYIIRLIGRHAVGNKDRDNCCDALNAYLCQEAKKHQHQPTISITKVLNGLEEVNTYLEKGKKILLYQSMAFSAILTGQRFYCMNTTEGPDVFDYMPQTDTTACMLLFSYQPTKNAWKVNCYTNKIRSVNVLRVIESLKDDANDTIYFLDGHEDACGFITTDIKKDLFDHLQML